MWMGYNIYIYIHTWYDIYIYICVIYIYIHYIYDLYIHDVKKYMICIYIYILHTVFSGFSWGYHIIPNRLINLNNGETTVKLAAQNPFRSEPQCCRTLLSYMCVLCEVLLHIHHTWYSYKYIYIYDVYEIYIYIVLSCIYI